MMTLSALIRKSKSKPIATDTVATHSREIGATVANVATVAVANPINAKTIQPSYRQKLSEYLAAIGETDQDMIDEYLSECSKDAAVLARALQQVDDFFQIQQGNTTDFARCSNCRQLSGDTCRFHAWRVAVDKWRKCSDFQPLPTTLP